MSCASLPQHNPPDRVAGNERGVRRAPTPSGYESLARLRRITADSTGNCLAADYPGEPSQPRAGCVPLFFRAVPIPGANRYGVANFYRSPSRQRRHAFALHVFHVLFHVIELARSVYQQYDRRAAIKRRINQRPGCGIIEEKSYPIADSSPVPP
jgi:hypothetical protein